MDTGKIKIVNISQIKLTKINLAFNNTRNIVFSVKAHRIVIVSSDHRLMPCLLEKERPPFIDTKTSTLSSSYHNWE